MLAEWFTHLTTSCQRPFRKMGYLGELIAIKHRHARCKSAWKPHLKNCKSLISEAALKVENKGSAVVLGSGQLLDIPIEFLSEQFDTVHLVDICHLKNTRKQTAAFTNINWVEADISGTVAPLNAWLTEKTLSMEDAILHPTPDLHILETADYVISSNLLAQLPLAPLHFIETNVPSLSAVIQEPYARRIMEQHLSLLIGLSCPVTLISEIEHIVSDGPQILERSEPLGGLELPTPDQEWEWDLAPRPELDPGFDLKLRVAGISNFNAPD